MNAQMRRRMDEDWEADDEQDHPEPPTTTTAKTKAAVQDRRQAEKQRGKAITKYHREHAKYTKRSAD